MHSFPTFLTAFNSQCQQFSESIALVHEKQSWTYKELDLLSDKIAEDLAHQGIECGAMVALLCVRSGHAIAAMIAVMKLGAAFVPVDTNYPDERIRYMLDDASVAGIVVDENQMDRLLRLNLASDIAVLITEQLMRLNSAQPESIAVTLPSFKMAVPSEEDAAYVMYTSGSTGKPKGVVISHGSLACYCRADIHAYELTASDRTLQFSTLSFDISIEEIFPPLCIGSTVVLRPSERSDAQIELSDIIERFSISAVHLATGYWHEWVDLIKATGARIPSSLRLMVVTGEKVSPEHYYRWLGLVSKPVLWANAYGPTETTVSATVFVPPAGWQGKALPIGKPLLGYSAYILDKNLQAVPSGETGDLFIGGGALSHGYLNRPELNRSVFLPDPFAPGSGARMYKTGDLARWLEDGTIDYAGRVDHQIKLGSYRVEPGEIENTINSYPGVNESLISALSINGTTQLIAYFSCADERLDICDVADYLAKKLPVYMLPGRYLSMPAMPKTINGKIDRDRLPDPEHAVVARRVQTRDVQNDIERKLHGIWCDILALPELGVDDSFISLGGDSLMAIRAIARIQKDLSFTLSTRDFFFLDTIALLAGHMQGKAVPRRVPAPEPAFINSRNRQIYTVLQRPATHNDNGRGILLVSPIGNEQRRVQRPFRNLMQNLSRQGYTLMRFDWRGTANSSGNTDQINSLQPWIDDLQDAAEQLANHVSCIDVVAIRMGALIASQTPIKCVPINARYYWDPVASGRTWLNEMETLHSGILNDTFRFLWPRKRASGEISEFAGLELNNSLITVLENEILNTNLEAYKFNQKAQLIVAALSVTGQINSSGSRLHVVDESNDWTDPRTTTDDMNIKKTASLLTDLLNEYADRPVELSLGRRA